MTALVALEQLTPAPWNPRRIEKSRLKNLAESIKADPAFLLRRPILAQSSGEIYAGNQRWHAAKLLFDAGWVPPWGEQTIPADLDDVPDQLAHERAIRDNNSWGEWDDDSGTTLIAAEQLGRRCYAMEIEPGYCDVTVRRWERVSGRQAIKANA